MRHNTFGKKLNRDIKTRNALFKSLVTEMVEHGKIKTTYPKAKAVRGLIEKTVTIAKKGTDNARRLVGRGILEKANVDKMMDKIAPAFAKRQGGYIRIIKMGKRVGDTAEAVTMEWTEKIEEEKKVKSEKVKVKNEEKKEEPKKEEPKKKAEKKDKKTEKK